MVNRKKAVQSGINICNDIYEEERYSDRDKMLRQQAASNQYQMCSNQVHNRKQVKIKGAASNRWLGTKAARSSMQQQQIQADYTVDNFVVLDPVLRRSRPGKLTETGH